MRRRSRGRRQQRPLGICSLCKHLLHVARPRRGGCCVLRRAAPPAPLRLGACINQSHCNTSPSASASIHQEGGWREAVRPHAGSLIAFTSTTQKPQTQAPRPLVDHGPIPSWSSQSARQTIAPSLLSACACACQFACVRACVHVCACVTVVGFTSNSMVCVACVRGPAQAIFAPRFVFAAGFFALVAALRMGLMMVVMCGSVGTRVAASLTATEHGCCRRCCGSSRRKPQKKHK